MVGPSKSVESEPGFPKRPDLAAGIYHGPAGLAIECFKLDEIDKTLLVSPAQKVIEKYNSDWLLNYMAEVSLAPAFALELRERVRQEAMETSKKEFQEVLKSRGPLGALKFLLGDKDNGGAKQIG